MTQRTLFLAAVEIADPVERETYLDSACAGDATLRQQVETLLTAHERPGEFLDAPAVPRPSGAPAAENPESCGSSNRSDGPVLDFLEPATKSGAIGRLGQYEILEVIGQGGMGIVFRAFDEALHRVVAIKVMAPQLAASAAARKRFLREAQAAAAVSHDHIVTIYAVAAVQPPYLVMELIEGQSLQEKIDREGPLELKVILRIAHQIACGLSAAHAHGLIHRDIKPSNILLQNGIERVQITDFGLARAGADVGVTQTGEVAGTPQYMSPEQAQAKPLDQRSDLFSMGSVLYAMCTGHAAFRADTPLAALRRVCDDTPQPIRDISPDVPEWLVEIIDRLLAKDADHRFQSAEEAAELLGRHLAHLQNPGSTPFPGTVRPIRRRATRIIGRRERWLVAGLVLFAAAASFGVSEATGVTHLSATVVRIVTGEGTLVIEVDDPSVQVSLDGEKLSISGAGLQEITLRPGQYQFQAIKNGVPVAQELVTITRGGRRVVGVRVELPVAEVEDVVSGEPSSSQILFSDDWAWSEPVNLGTTINGENQDGGPVLSQDGLTLVFESDRAGGAGSFDLWMSSRSALEAVWSPAVNLGSQINSDQQERTPFLASDGLTLLFASNRADGWGAWDLWMSTRARAAAEWSNAVNLGPTINSRWEDAGASLTSDGLVLLFHSRRPEGQGGSDLWLSRRASLNGEWSEPVSLGAEVNSEDEEYGPRISADGRTLLFSSNRPGGEGHLDLWVSRGASPFGPWSKPLNLGPQVNGRDNDAWGSLSGDAQLLVYGSVRPGNSGGVDLWMMRRVPRVDDVSRAEDLAQQGRYDDVAADFLNALDRPAASGEPATARRAIYERIAASEDVFNRVAAARPNDADLWLERGRYFARRSHWKEAVEHHLCAAGIAGEPPSWNEHMRLLLLAGNRDRYLSDCRYLIDQLAESKVPADAFRLAFACSLDPQSGVDPERVIKWAELGQGTRQDPFALYVLGMANYRAGEFEQAARLMHASLERHASPHAEAMFPLAMIYYRLGQFDESRKWFEAGTSLLRNATPTDPESPTTWALTNWLSCHLMLRESRAVLGVQPESADEFVARAEEFARRGEFDNAAADFLSVLDLLATSGEPDSARTAIYHKLAAWDDVFNGVAAGRPDDAVLWIERGRYFALRSQWAPALSHFVRAVELRDGLAGSPVIEYAILLLLNGDDAGYRRLCDQMAEQHGPTAGPGADFHLAAVCGLNSRSGVDPRQLVRLAEMANDHFRNKDSLFVLGIALYRAGRFAEAAEMMQERYKATPSSAMAETGLALACHGLGQAEEAQKWYRLGVNCLEAARPKEAGRPTTWSVGHWMHVSLLMREARDALEPELQTTDEPPAASEPPSAPETGDGEPELDGRKTEISEQPDG